MTKVKRAVSLLLTIVMMLSFMAIPADAEENFVVSVSNETATVTEEKGQDVTVDIDISGLGNADGWSALTFYVYYDSDVLTYKKWAPGSAYTAAKSAIEAESGTVSATIRAEKDAQDANGNQNYDEMCVGVAVTATDMNSDPAKMTGNGTYWKITFTAKEDLESQELPLKLVCIKTVFNGDSTVLPTTKDGSITINGVTPTLNAVTLDKDSVTVNGADGATVTAAATSA